MFADEALIEHEKKQDAKDKAIRSDDVIALCVNEKMIGVALIKRANNEHRKLLTTIRDQHVLRIDVYSKFLHEAYELLENHSSTDKNKRNDDSRRRCGRSPGREIFMGRGGRYMERKR